MIGGTRYSSTINRWAQPRRAWTDKGCCSRGVACWFRHEGFPTHGEDKKPIQRCIICGNTSHVSKDCTCPGGNKDLKKDEVWQAYRERKEKALAEGGAGASEQGGKGGKGGKGKKGDKGGKGKKCDKRGEGGQPATGPAAMAKAAAATEPGAVVSAATTTSRAPFPAGAAGLDSWANVYLKHNNSPEDANWTELLGLADGAAVACKNIRGS